MIYIHRSFKLINIYFVFVRRRGKKGQKRHQLEHTNECLKIKTKKWEKLSISL